MCVCVCVRAWLSAWWASARVLNSVGGSITNLVEEQSGHTSGCLCCEHLIWCNYKQQQCVREKLSSCESSGPGTCLPCQTSSTWALWAALRHRRELLHPLKHLHPTGLVSHRPHWSADYNTRQTQALSQRTSSSQLYTCNASSYLRIKWNHWFRITITFITYVVFRHSQAHTNTNKHTHTEYASRDVGNFPRFLTKQLFVWYKHCLLN